VILDLGLPDMDGLDLLVSARRRGVTAPMLVLSARDSIKERGAALDRGADDYSTRPFAFAELLARLRALVRRAHGQLAATAPQRSEVLPVDSDDPCMQIGARTVTLSPREHALVRHLAQHAGHVSSRHEICLQCSARPSIPAPMWWTFTSPICSASSRAPAFGSRPCAGEATARSK
jgi:DNA-binding response OmpR family regulator